MSMFGYSWLVDPGIAPYHLRSRSRSTRSDADNLDLSSSSTTSSASASPPWSSSFIQCCSCIPRVHKRDVEEDDDEREEYSRATSGNNIKNGKNHKQHGKSRGHNRDTHDPAIRIEFSADDDDDEVDGDNDNENDNDIDNIHIPSRLEDEDASLMSLNSRTTIRTGRHPSDGDILSSDSGSRKLQLQVKGQVA